MSAVASRRGTAAIARVAAACARHPWLTVAVAAALAAGAYAYTARHMAIDTDTTRLIARDVPWRQRELVFDAAFPQRADLIAVVVDAPTAEAAEGATATLAARLARERDRFRAVWRPDGGAFFDREGLLFESTADVAATMQALIAAQPLLGALAADPSLRGLAEALGRIVDGMNADPGRANALTSPLERLASAFEAAVAGRASAFSWRELTTGRPAEARAVRRFILVQPVLDYGALQPGAAATAAIRDAVRELRLGEDPPGVRVRLTGPVPLADEEFATLAEGAEFNALLMALAVVALLWAALRSWRLVAAILVSILAGLIVTAALGLWLFGAYNLISVAFAVLFVGLGVDFSIQYGVSYRAKRFETEDSGSALRAAAAEVGGAIALAAVSIAAGFFAFLPTQYRGVSELGAIAGSGMIVALVATITLLPALIVLLRPPGEVAAVGYARLAPLDRFLVRRRRAVVAAAAVVVVVSVALLPRLRFDFNPLHLKSPRAESVATLDDLARDPATTPYAIDVLAPSLDDAAALARRLEQVPEVDHAITLASFVPDDQPAKLALIGDAALLLEPVLHPATATAPATDESTVRAVRDAAAAIERAATTWPAPAATAAARLGRALRTLAEGPPAARERARAMLIPGLVTTLAQLRLALQAEPVTLAGLPGDLRRDWVAADGRARIEVFPRGNMNDNAELRRFVRAVLALAPEATGAPVSIEASAGTIGGAFVQAGAWALLSIVALLALALRNARDVLLAVAPIAASGLATLGVCAAFGLPLNFENVIALPLLLGIGVAFSVYFVVAWRAGRRDLLQSSLTRAVIFSALTTGTAFGSLWLSNHPGTSGMGRLLALSLACTLASTLLLLPALLGEPRPH